MANNSAISYFSKEAIDLSTGSHPTGWVSGQRWYTTSAQWQAMFQSSNNAAFDPETFSYSYPGQPANTKLWSDTAQYWKTQTDTAWGPSGVWNSGSTWHALADFEWGPSRVYNSGSTWETMYNNEVTLYNNEVTLYNNEVTAYNTSQANLATWTSNANNAWGPSRVYASGSSWESMYNSEVTLYNNEVALYNANIPAALDHLATSGSAAGDNVTHAGIASLTTNRAGQWVVVWGATNSNTATQTYHVDGYVGGGFVGQSEAAATGPGRIGFVWQGNLGSGVVLRGDGLAVGNGTVTVFIDAWFIPTPANPQ